MSWTERTEKVSLGSIKTVVSEPIEGHQEYHLMVGCNCCFIYVNHVSEKNLFLISELPSAYIQTACHAAFTRIQFFWLWWSYHQNLQSVQNPQTKVL